MSNYQVGGSLRLEAPYVKRSADNELYQALLARQFCYVFNCRQMGKSSLRVRIVERLKQAGIGSLSIDLSTIGTSGLSARQWYASIIKALHNEMRLTTHLGLKVWLKEQEDLTPVQLLFLYIEEILLPHIDSEHLVIFLDEIDCVRDLSFDGSDFFSLIRACYNRRVDDLRYEHLNFVLLGVATPSGLVQDANKTPFNIGKGIELTGLEFKHAGALIQGLTNIAKEPQSVLRAVLHWTGGQPFLTQKLCQLLQTELSEPIASGDEVNKVAKFVNKSLIDQWQFYDEPVHFKSIHSRVLIDESQSAKLLGLYQRILMQGGIPWNGSPEHQNLRLTGLVVRQGKQLKTYNPIYQKIFSVDWVEQELRQLRPDYYREGLKQWLDSGKNPSWLLRGEALQQALQWSESLSLSELDNKYLKASQSQDKQVVMAAYEEVKQKWDQAVREEAEARYKANSALETIKILEIRSKKLKNQEEEAKNQLKLASIKRDESIQNYKTNKKLTVISLTLTICLLFISFFLVMQIIQSDAERRITVKGNAIDRETGIVRQNISELQVLWKTLRLGFQLKQLITEEDLAFSQYPAIQPIYTLSSLKESINEKNQYLGHKKSVNSARFSPNGETILTASFDRTVKLWKSNGKILQEYNFRGRIRSVEFHPKDQAFIIASEDKTARLWSIDGEEKQVFRHNKVVTHAIFSPDGEQVLTASRDGTARLWDLNGIEKVRISNDTQLINSILFSPDGETILTALNDGTTRLLDLKGNERLILDNQDSPVMSAAFGPNGERIVTALRNGTVTVWSVTGEKQLTIKGGSSAIHDAKFSPDGLSLITSSNSTLKMWDLEGNQIQEYKGHTGIVKSIDFSPDGQAILTASDDRTARLWNLDGRGVIRIHGHTNTIKSIDHDPNSNFILSASSDSTATIWNLQGDKVKTLISHQKPINSAVFSSDGKLIVTASEDYTAKLWDLNSNNSPLTLQGHTNILRNAVFSPDDQFILTSSNDKTARLWTRNGRPLIVFSGHDQPVRFASFSSTGKKVVTASADRTARLWDLKGNEITKLQGHTNWVTRAVFSPDDTLILTASFDATARLWNTNGSLVHILQGHSGRLIDAAFSPDGEFILTTSFDGTARVWDREGNTLQILTVPNSLISSANFSSDGKNIIVGSNSGELYVRKIESLSSLLSWGCSWIRDYIENAPTVSALDKEMCHTLTSNPDQRGHLRRKVHFWQITSNWLRVFIRHGFKGYQFKPNTRE